MSTSNVLSVIARRKYVAPAARNRPAVGFASPTALQMMMQILANLEQKVDALATKPRARTMVVPTRAKVQPQKEMEELDDVDKPEEQTTALAETPKPTVKRSRLLEFFD